MNNDYRRQIQETDKEHFLHPWTHISHRSRSKARCPCHRARDATSLISKDANTSMRSAGFGAPISASAARKWRRPPPTFQSQDIGCLMGEFQPNQRTLENHPFAFVLLREVAQQARVDDPKHHLQRHSGHAHRFIRRQQLLFGCHRHIISSNAKHMQL